MASPDRRRDQVSVGMRPLFARGFVDDGVWSRSFARAIETAGVESVWACEHVVMAEDPQPRYPYSDDGRMPSAPDVVMPDPIEWLAHVAAVTDRLRLGTSVMVLPLHPPAVTATRVATLDRLSGGRVLLGVGSGWQVEEYAACGVDYGSRGPRLDEAIAAVRELWQPGPRSFDGVHYRFDRVECAPGPSQPGGPPVIIGGSSPAAARRAGRTGDGFHPHAVSPERLAELLEVMRESARRHDREPDRIEVTVWPGSWRADAALDRDVLGRYVALGVGRVMTAAKEAGTTSLDGICEHARHLRDVLDAL